MPSSAIEYTLITGGTAGIGLELARVFASNGHNLVIVARNNEELQNVAADLKQHNIKVITIQKDLFNPEHAFDLHEEIKQKDLRVNILVNNAGQGQYGLFEDTDIHRELAIIQLNISSLVVLSKLFLHDMLKKGRGKILNLSSIASKTPGPWQSVYHATKAFVQSFTEAVRAEVKDKGITVTALLPGATDTDFFRKADMLDSKVMEGKLDDPATVAKNGYDALMSDDDMVVSGIKNKVTVAMTNLMPDSAAASSMKKKQAPKNESL